MNGYEKKDITILIKTFNRKRSLLRLLHSLKKLNCSLPIFIADDSDKPYRDLILSRFPELPIEYYVLLPDSGLSAGRNFLLNKVKTEYFLLCDDDFSFDHRLNISHVVSAMKTDELDIGGGTVLNYTTVTSAAGFLRLVLDPGRLYRFLKHIPGIARYYGNFDVQQATCTLAISNQEPNSPVQLCDIVSNFFIARTASVLRMKGWDEYFKVGEHEDFFYRAKLAGLKVALVNDFATRHYPGAGKAYRLYRERAFELKRDFPKKFCFNAYKEINADDKSIIFSYKPDEERPRPLNDRP